MFSSYLFFIKDEKYFTMLKKKLKSLALPYFIWTLLMLCGYVLIKIIMLKIKSSLLRHTSYLWPGTDILKWLKVFFYYDASEGLRTPFVVQFWYLRNLLALFIISPVLKFFYKRFPKTSLIAVIFIYCSHLMDNFGIAIALLFFTLGYYWAKGSYNLFKIADSFYYAELIIIFAAGFILKKFSPADSTACNSVIIFTSAMIWLKISDKIVKSPKAFDISRKLSGYSFFLYAVHMPLLTSAALSVCDYLIPDTKFTILLIYPLIAVSVVISGTLIGIIVKKLCPPLFRVLSGGR